jgi:scyllo-inositol 2-dehydrogenase (NADP+)
MPLRAAIFGFGTSGRVFHGPLLAADPEFEVAAIATANDERRADAATLHPAAEILAHADDVFARAEALALDLVVIGTPPVTHAELAHRAIDAGLAVVIDKPFVPTSAAAREVIAHAADAGVPLTVFQNRRLDADFLTLRQLIDDGRLGTVHRFESRFEWWKPTLAKEWKAETTAADGGGILFDLGTHLIDQAVQLFGEVVEASAEIDTRRPGGRADDDTFVALQHRGGVRSHLWMSSLAAQAGARFHVLGSESAYTKWGLDGQEAQLKSGLLPTDEGYGVEPETAWGLLGIDGDTSPVPAHPGSYPLFYRQLADALLRDGSLPVDPADALHVLELIERLRADIQS